MSDSAEHRSAPQPAPQPLARCIQCGSVVHAENIGQHLFAFHRLKSVYAQIYIEQPAEEPPVAL
jgi:hypothetical protein